MILVYLSIVVQGGFQHGKLKVRVNLALFPPALRTFSLARFARSLTNTAIFLGGFPHLHCHIKSLSNIPLPQPFLDSKVKF